MTPAPEYILKTTPAPGKTVGYVRVSTLAQNPERQLEGVPLNKVFTDYASGKTKDRPQLQAMLDYVREGDTVVVHSIDRLARNLVDLRRLVRELNMSGVRVEFKKEGMVFGGRETAAGTFLLNMMGGFAEFERAMSYERMMEGVALAKKEKRYKGRAPAIRANNGKAEIMERLHAKGARVCDMARQAGVSRQTVYSWLAKQKSANNLLQTKDTQDSIFS